MISVRRALLNVMGNAGAAQVIGGVGVGGNLIKQHIFNLQSSYWYQIKGFFTSYISKSLIIKNGALLWYLTEKIKYTFVKNYIFDNIFGLSVNILNLCIILELRNLFF